MPNNPPIAGSSAQRGFLPPGPGLFRFQFDVPADGLDKGYLEGPTPPDGQPLDDFCQQLVAGITGLRPDLVRPLWQAEPANLPDWGTDWAAVGVTDSELDRGWAYFPHDPASGGRSTVKQHEVFTLLCAFYGPHADAFDGLLRDGLSVPQNSEVFMLNAMGLVDWHSRVVAPVLIKQRWLRRVDRRVRIHREIRRQYPVLNILTVPVAVTAQGPGAAVISRTKTVVPTGIT